MNEANVKSAQRVLEIIECLGRMRQPMRLKHFVAELGYPSSSLAALLKCMTQLGYLAFDDVTHSYSLTGRLASLTSWAEADSFEDGVVENVLRDLQKETGELVLLSAEAGLYTEYVKTYRALGDGIQLYISPGTRRLLIQNGSGWLLLSRRSDHDVAEIYRQTVRNGYITQREFPFSALMKRVESSRNKGVNFATARDSVRPMAHWGGGLASVIIPVPEGHRNLTICIGGLAERLEQKLGDISRALRTARERIAESIGDKVA